ncbi:hypothetical protein [Microbispora sp. GKU 823]|uniref:hypothetical protein n=1 Tax=Microbispora sp. GKU 823 TaxID=1652100 RepID=UPI0009A43F68|nr:hypothetical protein [Microbispora sp. GKU 823]OPG13663.1 hypothetical protein B1L11_06660 [Microbispora sp. GKU 823]
MPDIPAEAVQAAAEAIGREHRESREWDTEAFARAALEAAAPFIAGQERARIAAHLRGIPDDDQGFRTGTRRFIDRHDRLREGSSIVAVLLAAADEIEHGTAK